MKKNSMPIIALGVVAVLAIVLIAQRQKITTQVVSQPSLSVQASPSPTASPIAQVTYACAGAKTIQATYYPDLVSLVLSDGRSLTLPQAMSGSGARYAWEKGGTTFVFWNKGNTAFIEENNTTTYSDCNEK